MNDIEITTIIEQTVFSEYSNDEGYYLFRETIWEETDHKIIKPRVVTEALDNVFLAARVDYSRRKLM